MIQQNVSGVYVYSIELGSNVAEDTSMGFFANMNDQIPIVCAKLAADPNLKDGFNAVGFSQVNPPPPPPTYPPPGFPLSCRAQSLLN